MLGLRDAGNTVLLIEHNTDLIACSDWVVDMGPEGGEQGGYIVAEGTPEDVAADPASHTGRFLKATLDQHAGLTKPRPKAPIAVSSKRAAPPKAKAAARRR